MLCAHPTLTHKHWHATCTPPYLHILVLTCAMLLSMSRVSMHTDLPGFRWGVFFFAYRHVALVLLLFQTSTVILTMRYSLAQKDGPPYIKSSAVVMSELLKLVCALHRTPIRLPPIRHAHRIIRSYAYSHGLSLCLALSLCLSLFAPQYARVPSLVHYACQSSKH